MSESVALTGEDTTIINNRPLADLANQDCVNLDFPNEIATLSTGKNGNTVYSVNNEGEHCNVTIRTIRGSSDDKFLNNLKQVQKSNFAGFVLLTGEFIKKVGDGQGNITNDTYLLSGGIFVNEVNAKENVNADTEQSISIYQLRFARAPRALT